MKAERSPLFLRTFYVLSSQMSAHLDDAGVDESKTMADLHDELAIEIDYNHFIDEEGFHIDMLMQVNKGQNPKFGYILKVESRGIFEINSANALSEQMKSNLELFSAVNIMLSSMRGYLRDITSYGALGSYLLPSIDMGKLVREKTALEQGKAIKDTSQ